MKTTTNQDSRRLERIKWRSHRGLLELDIIFTRFFERDGASLSDDDLAMLEQALLLPDNDLLDYVMQRAPLPEGARFAPIIERLQAV